MRSSEKKTQTCGYGKYHRSFGIGDEMRTPLLDSMTVRTSIGSTPITTINIEDFFTSGSAVNITSAYNPPNMRTFVTIDGGVTYAIANIVYPNPHSGGPPITIQFVGIDGTALTETQSYMPEFVVAGYNASLLPIVSFSGVPTTQKQQFFDGYSTCLWYAAFLWEQFGRAGILGKSVVFPFVMNVPIVNAFWNGHYITFGRSALPAGNVLTGFDIVGHEITHGIIDAIGSNNYFGESGSINEAMCDIIGTTFEKYFDSKTGRSLFDWTIAEDPFGSPLRHFADPNIDSNSKNYYGNFWGDTSDPIDNGGIYTNIGCITYLFYLCVAGSSGVQTNDFGADFNIVGPLWPMNDFIKWVYYSYPNSLGADTYKPIKYEADFKEFVSTLVYNFPLFSTQFGVDKELLVTFKDVLDALEIKLVEYVPFDPKKFKNRSPYYVREVQRPETSVAYMPKKRVNIFSLVTQPSGGSYQPRKFPKFLSS